MFLAANTKSTINRYYKKLDFVQNESWNDVGQEVFECATLESKDLTDLLPMKLSLPVPNNYPTTTYLFLRTLKTLPRPINDLKASPDGCYSNKMKSVLMWYVNEPLADEKKWNDDILQDFNETVPSCQSYKPNGPEWNTFHVFLTGKAMMHHWEIKNAFQIPYSDNDRAVGTFLPLEELMMDYCSFGKVIENNIPHKNTFYNVFCQRCKCKMTKLPMKRLDMKLCSLAIVEKHFLFQKEQHLCLATKTEYDYLHKRIERGEIEVIDKILRTNYYN